MYKTQQQLYLETAPSTHASRTWKQAAPYFAKIPQVLAIPNVNGRKGVAATGSVTGLGLLPYRHPYAPPEIAASRYSTSKMLSINEQRWRRSPRKNPPYHTKKMGAAHNERLP